MSTTLSATNNPRLPVFRSKSPATCGRSKSPRQLPSADYSLPRVERTPVASEWFVPKLRRNVQLAVARPEDHDVLLEFLLNEFGTQETLNLALGLTRSDLLAVMHETLLAALSLGLSIVAVDQGRLIGVIVNNWHAVEHENKRMPRMKEDYGEDLNAPSEFPLKSRKIHVILSELKAFLPSFLPAHADRAFYVDIVSVAPQYAGCGIGKRLFRESFRLAKAAGFRFCFAICTATASTRIAESLGMENRFVFVYREFVCDGERVFPATMRDDCEGASLMVGDLQAID
ncbi:N-acetyltransferase domain-containing protein [Aphelenchoides fujianensis]|nr:N-acetyltransferase domain-containing protein [Aphelenchoides fujianensis]